MTHPKGKGRSVILDLSFGDFSVKKARRSDVYDGLPFTLNLPKLDYLIPTLNKLGSDAGRMKIDISHAFRNVRVDPADTFHLVICWLDKFYLDKI